MIVVYGLFLFVLMQRLKFLTKQAGHPVHLRVLVDQGGCSGLSYKFQIEHDAVPEDEEDM